MTQNGNGGGVVGSAADECRVGTPDVPRRRKRVRRLQGVESRLALKGPEEPAVSSPVAPKTEG